MKSLSRTISRWLMMALAAAVLAACGSQGAPLRAGASGDSLPQVQVTQYRLGPGDELRIVVFGQAQMTGQFVVNDSGSVAFPLIGSIPAQGLTVTQFTEHLAEALRQGYVRDPNINVEVSKYRPFYILGEVGKPGTYPFSAGLTVMRAVATAEGFTYRANSHVVFIQHPDEASERQYELTSSTPVQPGDTVRIPERRF